MSTNFVTLQNAATATGNGTVVDVAEKGRIGLQVAGITTATVSFEASVDGSNFAACALGAAATPATPATSATADGLFVGDVAGFRLFRARISAWTSGSVTATALVSSAED